MCDSHLDRSSVWNETVYRAAKEHRCEECNHPIFKGQRYTRIKSMYDGSWSDTLLHSDCLENRRYVALDVCRAQVYGIGSDEGLTIQADLVRHAQEYPHAGAELRRRAKNLKERRRKEAIRYAKNDR